LIEKFTWVPRFIINSLSRRRKQDAGSPPAGTYFSLDSRTVAVAFAKGAPAPEECGEVLASLPVDPYRQALPLFFA
jgi:hypothetical protein